MGEGGRSSTRAVWGCGTADPFWGSLCQERLSDLIGPFWGTYGIVYKDLEGSSTSVGDDPGPSVRDLFGVCISDLFRDGL